MTSVQDFPISPDLEAQNPAQGVEASTLEFSTPSPQPLPQSPTPFRRKGRTNTARAFPPPLPNWQPGQEPGIDLTRRKALEPPQIYTECQITAVDFSEDGMKLSELDNHSLESYLLADRDDWVRCRWINVNGLSRDVIELLQKHKRLHRLAIEDLIGLKNRTKADWYSDHTYIVLTLQKLVRLPSESGCEDDSSDLSWSESDTGALIGHKKKSKGEPLFTHLRRLFGRPKPTTSPNADSSKGSIPTKPLQPLPELRTLQRYHGGQNLDRIEYMERNSSLQSKGLAVGVEQVSIFITADNTVISFFEGSADDIEIPILARLGSAETLLRKSCDSSMLLQAIIDAIIDLAIPVVNAYGNALSELELEVLTEPAIKNTTSLYILMSEINLVLSNVKPIGSLINALRDHRSEAQAGNPPNKSSGVGISPMAFTYLGDVEDHCVLLTGEMDRMRRSADNMIQLIFNTIDTDCFAGASQNESMRQLTLVTILFLPLTFLTGYFGMNFHLFDAVQENSDRFFWIIAAPVCFIVILFLMRDILRQFFSKTLQKRLIYQSRRRREEASKKKKTM
ncbi:MAG: hypothetical protein M1829_002957 [Trizodia sp. TS-e1964]|nr:MAG: hypothetical protein M1829_002957 [Trizodia sp. TS-e1964]